MPRVTPEHAEGRRLQILEAARTAFLRDGFHATSMQDIQRESGLSAGAIYLYFKSKNAIVVAIATEVLATVMHAFDQPSEADLPDGLSGLMDRLIDTANRANESRQVFSLAVQIWAETQRDPVLHESVLELFGTVQARLMAVLVGFQERGAIDVTVDVEALAKAIIGLVAGYIVMTSLRIAVDRAQYQAGIHALMRSGVPRPPS